MGNQTTRTLRILLADDDEDVRSTVRLILEMDHHEVVESSDGVEALRSCASSPFDLVITDYIMPEMSGDLLAVEIKKLYPALPIIMITANADLLPTSLPGIERVLSKPFRVNDLLREVHEVLLNAPPAGSKD
jgi:CheY-like chemotaxis protein